MVLAAGSEFIEDVRKAPDDVLSMKELMFEVRYCKVHKGAHTQKNYLALSTRIYAGL